jgi:hypothetical protein
MFARNVSIHLKPNSSVAFNPADRERNDSNPSKASGLSRRTYVPRSGRSGSCWD